MTWPWGADDAATLSSKLQFVSSVLGLGTNGDAPSELVLAQCNLTQCARSFSDLQSRDEAASIPWVCCGQISGLERCDSQLKSTTGLTPASLARGMFDPKGAAAINTAVSAQGGAPMQSGPPDQQGGAPMQSGPPGAQGGAPMQSGPPGAQGGASMQSGYPGCHDVLDHSTFSASYGNAFMQYLVDRLLPANGSCKGGCPLLRPLCNGTSCIRPSCADLVHAGMKCSGDKDEKDEREREEQLSGECSIGEAGVNALALAQSMCSVTCGCSRGKKDDSGGCLPECGGIPGVRNES